MKFSIVTPSFRNSAWLKLCIASVADQGIEHEHIVQDAGSDDGTLDWLAQDKRVRAFVEKDAGMYDGINRGLRKCSGEYLAYLNCDEQYLPGALRRAAEFLDQHPDVEILFGDAVCVNADGEYLWHRKMLVPRMWHTWTCALSVLTCATFFRRGLVERGFFFDERWKIVGDSDWVLRLLQAGVRAAVFRQFTSVFTHTGSNLSRNENAVDEMARFWSQAPRHVRILRPGILLHHRLRRLLGGIYFQQPFTYELFTPSHWQSRVVKRADKPTFRWRW